METITPHTMTAIAQGTALELVQSCFATTLEVDDVGPDDDFFALGGHSMLGVRLIAGLRAGGMRRVTLREVFDHPTPASLTALIVGDDGCVATEESVVTDRPPIVRRDPSAGIQLSFAQEGFLMLNQMTGGDADAYFNQRCAFMIHGEVDLGGLQFALNRIIERHELLRTVEVGDEWRVLDDCRSTVVSVTADGSTPAERLIDAHRLAGEISNEPFDLRMAPLIRIAAIDIEPGLTGLVIVLNHIASDWVALDIASRELAEHYREYVEGTPADVPELAIQYWDFAAWQRGLSDSGVFDRQLEYWDKRLEDAEMYLLPTALDDEVEWEPWGRTHEFDIPEDVIDAIRAVAASQSATLFMGMLAVTNTAISEITGRRRVAVAAFAANRRDEEIQHLIGIFPNIQVLATDVGGAGSFASLVGDVRSLCMDAQNNGDVPFHSLLEVPSFARWMNRQEQHWVLFYVHEMAPWDMTLPGATVTDWAGEVQSNAYPPMEGTLDPETGSPYLQIGPVDLDITFLPTPGGFRCRLSYNTTVFDRPSIERFAAHLSRTLTRIATSAAS